MATTQLNVRINAQDKVLGDEALASIDYTPSRMVQAVWGYAARNRRNKKALRKLAEVLEDETRSEEMAEKERRAALIQEGPQIFMNMMKEMGIEDPFSIELPSDDELLYQAYLDKMAERGMSA
ncbi:MAG: hypothetical protein IJ131_00835 [Eggerthellaceae bacterium]|nr:hypothetical protein [Eggerthellaceae bacterium]